MAGQPRSDREWEHWPEERPGDEGIRHRLRDLFHPSAHDDEAVEELVAQHGRELELRAAQLAETIADLERREQRTSELRLAVEQMLRRGSSELDERHAELSELAARLAEREALAAETERLLAERRTELGAVELRRAALERHESAVAEREEALARQAADLAEREQLLAEVEQRADELVARSTEVAAREERLTLTTENAERERAELASRLASLREHEIALGDLDEQRRALERDTAELDRRAAELALEASRVGQQHGELRRAVASVSDALGLPAPLAASGTPEPDAASEHLLFVPGERYSLIVAEGRAPKVDTILELESGGYRVIRLARSPLPADARRCALLERIVRGEDSRGSVSAVAPQRESGGR